MLHLSAMKIASSQVGKNHKHVSRFLVYVTALVSLSCGDCDDDMEVVDVVGLAVLAEDAVGGSLFEGTEASVRFEIVGIAVEGEVECFTELAEVDDSFTSFTLGCGQTVVRLTLCSAVSDVFKVTHELFSMLTCSM